MYNCTYNLRMNNTGYEWDKSKAKSNLRKPGVDFADAVSVFADDFALTVEDDYLDEERYTTLGIDALGRILVVVYTWREDNVRIISARNATRYECKQYEE